MEEKTRRVNREEEEGRSELYQRDCRGRSSEESGRVELCEPREQGDERHAERTDKRRRAHGGVRETGESGGEFSDADKAWISVKWEEEDVCRVFRERVYWRFDRGRGDYLRVQSGQLRSESVHESVGVGDSL